MISAQTCASCGTVYTSGACPTCVQPESASPPPILAPGQSFHGLEILGPLGQGGMGVVLKARQTTLDRLVALKVLPPGRAGDLEFQERFEREAKAMAALSHPGLITVHDFGRDGETYFLVMEFVDGENLRQRIQRQRPTPPEAIKLLIAVCDALEYAHEAGIVHRDIKPENIMLDKNGRVKIADFGLAKMVGGDQNDFMGLTQSGAAMGTLRYMAPEQGENSAKVDHRADLYSAGVVLYELLTGELPMGKFDPASIKSSLDARIDEIVLKALEKDPAKRYASAAEFRAALERFLSTPAEAPRPKRSRLPVAIAVVAVLALGGAVVGWKVLRKPVPPPAEKPRETVPPASAPTPSRYESLRTLTGHDREVYAAAFHPKKAVLATAGLGREILIRNAADGPMIRKLECSSEPLCLAFSPDGLLLASGWKNGGLHLWNSETGREVAVLKGHGAEVWSLAFTPDGRSVVSGSYDGTIRIWDVEARTERRRIPKQSERVLAIAVRPDGKEIASADDRGAVTLWALPDGSKIRSFAAHKSEITTIAFSPDGTRLLSCGHDQAIRLWNPERGAEVRSFPGHTGDVNAVAFHPMGTLLASAGGDKTVRLWNADSGEEIQKIAVTTRTLDPAPYSIAFSSDGAFLAWGTGNGVVEVWKRAP